MQIGKKTLEAIVLSASLYTREDPKVASTPRAVRALKRAGARLHANHRMSDRNWLTEVEVRGVVFVAVTRKPMFK